MHFLWQLAVMDAGIQHSSVSKCCRSVVRSGKDSEKTPHLTCSMWDFEVPPVYLLYYTNSARCFYVQYYANFYHLHDCKGLFLQHFNSSNIECLNTLKKKINSDRLLYMILQYSGPCNLSSCYPACSATVTYSLA